MGDDAIERSTGATINMGATGNPNAAKLATLQERKKSIEESLEKCTHDLKQLCIQEANLTGVKPSEMPLDPGEPPPSLRRHVGATYTISEDLIKNMHNKNQMITEIELSLQTHSNMAQAALDRANDQNISKTLRRQHKMDYQYQIEKLAKCQEKLALELSQQQQAELLLTKQKKKPRPVDDDNVSISTTANNEPPFVKSDLRHSIRSNKFVPPGEDNVEQQQTYPLPYNNIRYRNSSSLVYQQSQSSVKNEDTVARGLYRMNLNGYTAYIERQQEIETMSYYNNKQYYQHHQQEMYQHHQRPQTHHLYPTSTLANNYVLHQHSPTKSHPYHQQLQQQQQQMQATLRLHHHVQSQQQQQHHHYNHHRSSPNTHPRKMSSSSSTLQHDPYRKYHQSPSESDRDHFHASNPHQIQPHQQYEHTGLGGHWGSTETGEMVWLNNSDSLESGSNNWQRDRRFGSLDRRKNRKLHKRISPGLDNSNKCATLASVATYSDHVRTAATAIKSPQVIARRSLQENRQLVRTQSLGSVGAQTVDSVWPSDDNSSCESDNRSINDPNHGSRKPKPKEWMETSLDGPVSPTHSVISRSQSAFPSVVLSPEEKYNSPPLLSTATPPPLSPKPLLEIPAESNPSPRMLPDATNIELLNNNVMLKNCTVVQAGHCKPYHEETKPFEMSDFYKYSTKYKKSPMKQPPPPDECHRKGQHLPRNLTETFENNNSGNISMIASPGDNSGPFNTSLDLSQLSNANVAERFSDEMNAWYKSHALDNVSSTTQPTVAHNNNGKGKSTATLV